VQVAGGEVIRFHEDALRGADALPSLLRKARRPEAVRLSSEATSFALGRPRYTGAADASAGAPDGEGLACSMREAADDDVTASECGGHGESCVLSAAVLLDGAPPEALPAASEACASDALPLVGLRSTGMRECV